MFKSDNKNSFSYRLLSLSQIFLMLIGFGYLSYQISNHSALTVQLQNDLLRGFPSLPSSGSKSEVLQLPGQQIAHSPPNKIKETMREIGSRTHTDKVDHHGYERYYPLYLEKYRDDPNFKMLEIGFLNGASYKMWLDYFPLGKSYFIEIEGGSSYPEARFKGDSSNPVDLERLLVEKNVKHDLDLIIDDGSHDPVHIDKAFKYLWVHGLKPGGVYIMEDIERNYFRNGQYKYGKSTTFV
jgi:hypothetical protein